MKIIILIVVVIFNSMSSYCQYDKHNIAQEELDGYIKTSFNIIELIEDNNLTGVWGTYYYKNQDTTNIRNLINNTNKLIGKYGIPTEEKIKVKYVKYDATDTNPVTEYVDIIFPFEVDGPEIDFTFVRSIGSIYVVAVITYQNKSYQDFLDFKKKMEENEK